MREEINAMKDFFLISYAVKGIKGLDEWVRLSFYKKIFSKLADIHKYNVKGIYGTNGAGKSAIVSSVKIIKNLLINDNYLNNPLVQKKLSQLINKNLNILEFDIEFLVVFEKKIKTYRYELSIEEDHTGRFYIKSEILSARKDNLHTDRMINIYTVDHGRIMNLLTDDDYSQILKEKSFNLLLDSSLTSIAIKKKDYSKMQYYAESPLYLELVLHYLLGTSIYSYLDSEDEHTDYLINDWTYMFEESSDLEVFKEGLKEKYRPSESGMIMLQTNTMIIPKSQYDALEKQVKLLKEFLHVFKPSLKNISIDKRSDKDNYFCNLIINYDDYNVHVEYESTGIKKLIKLFSFFKIMVDGNIVFIDEMDANLHDVYLCALLEYLMEHGKGQLCFTTHNIGPMDILKRNKKSIDFLSVDKHIYSWANNGNYSPSKLYRLGMIEGSPFNVDSIDFLGVFGSEEE